MNVKTDLHWAATQYRLSQDFRDFLIRNLHNFWAVSWRDYFGFRITLNVTGRSCEI